MKIIDDLIRIYDGDRTIISILGGKKSEKIKNKEDFKKYIIKNHSMSGGFKELDNEIPIYSEKKPDINEKDDESESEIVSESESESDYDESEDENVEDNKEQETTINGGNSVNDIIVQPEPPNYTGRDINPIKDILGGEDDEEYYANLPDDESYF